MLAEAKTASRGVLKDFTRCDNKLSTKFEAIEERYGEYCALFTVAGAKNLISRDASDMACRLATPGQVRRMEKRGSIVVSDFYVEPPNADPTLALRNVKNIEQHGRCFYVTTEGGCMVGQEFDLTVPVQSERRWKASSGFGSEIPAVPTIPFTGSLVCVALDESDYPIMSNGFTVSYSDRITCGIDGGAVAGIDFFAVPDFDLVLDNNEYELCLPGRESEIETCWSQSPTFNFDCE
jgi:hypothetical protein